MKDILFFSHNQKKITEVGSLSAAAAHELGTPLNTIFLIINDLLKENGDLFLSGPSARKYLDSNEFVKLRKNIIFQNFIGDLKNETILHVIASYENPLEYINKIGDWKYLE